MVPPSNSFRRRPALSQSSVSQTRGQSSPGQPKTAPGQPTAVHSARKRETHWPSALPLTFIWWSSAHLWADLYRVDTEVMQNLVFFLQEMKHTLHIFWSSSDEICQTSFCFLPPLILAKNAAVLWQNIDRFWSYPIIQEYSRMRQKESKSQISPNRVLIIIVFGCGLGSWTMECWLMRDRN